MYATVEKDRHQAFQSVLRSVFCLLVTPQTLAGKKIYYGGETRDNLLMQSRDSMDDALKFPICTVLAPTSSFVTPISPAFFTLPSFNAPSPYTSTICL